MLKSVLYIYLSAQISEMELQFNWAQNSANTCWIFQWLIHLYRINVYEHLQNDSLESIDQYKITFYNSELHLLLL